MGGNKQIVLMGVIAGCLAVAGFALSTNYSDKEDLTQDFKSTTDGSYYTKHLFVNVDAAKAEVEEIKKQQESGEAVITVNASLGATSGKMQGLWSKADGTNVTPEEFEQNCQQVYGDYWNQWSQWLGVEMKPEYTSPVSVQFDPHKDKFGDGVGLIHYYQNPAAHGLPAAWDSFNQNVVKGGSATISGSGCGPTALSASLSTMLHKYITPIEIVAARDTMYLRLGQSPSYMFGMWSSGTKGAMSQGSEKVCEFVGNLKYNGQQLLQCTKENLIQARVDETLSAGGFIILVPHGRGGSGGTAIGEYWTGGGHYIAIRAKDSEGNYYTVDGSHDSDSRVQGNHDVPHPWSDIQGCGYTEGAVHYISPGPGYSDYIQSLDG